MESFKPGDIVAMQEYEHITMVIRDVDSDQITTDWMVNGEIKTHRFHSKQLKKLTQKLVVLENISHKGYDYRSMSNSEVEMIIDEKWHNIGSLTEDQNLEAWLKELHKSPDRIQRHLSSIIKAIDKSA